MYLASPRHYPKKKNTVLMVFLVVEFGTAPPHSQWQQAIHVRDSGVWEGVSGLDLFFLLQNRSVNLMNSFCRKTTLTKHFRRWHTDEEISSEEGSDVGHEDPPDGVMTRQSSSYAGELWPVPGHAAQPPRSLPFEGTLVSRPKLPESVKTERIVAASLPEPLSLPNSSPGMNSFEYLRSQTGLTPEQVGIQTVLPTHLNGMPPSQQYPVETGMGTWVPSMLTTKLCPSSFSDYPSEPPSAQSTTVYFPDSAPQDYQLQVVDIHLNESLPFSPDLSAPILTSTKLGTNVIPAANNPSNGYNVCSTPISEHHVPISPTHLSTPLQPQQLSMSTGLVPFYALADNGVQYYQSPVPEWYSRIKPEESWPGVLPSDYLYN